MSHVLSEDDRVDDPGRGMEKGGESNSETDIFFSFILGSPVLSHSQKNKKCSKRSNRTIARAVKKKDIKLLLKNTHTG